MNRRGPSIRALRINPVHFFPNTPIAASRPGGHVSFESISVTSDLSYLEATVWGQLYYAAELEVVESGAKGIHLNSFVGHLLVNLEHARRAYSELGFDGTLLFLTKIERVRRVPFLYFPGGVPKQGPYSRLDDTIEFPTDFSSETLEQHRDEIAAQLLRTIFLSLNWPAAATEGVIDGFIKDGYKYNFW